jgi:GNAT superfamily N-acetyltransferase
MQKPISNLTPPSHYQLSQIEIDEILEFLLPISSCYPQIDKWFIQKVIPGISLGTRYVLCIRRKGQIVALGIAKKDKYEKKICTLRVVSEYTRQGIGTYLFNHLLHWLESTSPIITVNEERLSEFQSLFAKYSFVLTSIRNNLYIPGHAEYIFNEPCIKELKVNQ